MSHYVTIWRNINVASFFAPDNGTYLWSWILIYTLHCTALHCTALHCTALYCTALHCTALHCTDLHIHRNSLLYFVFHHILDGFPGVFVLNFISLLLTCSRGRRLCFLAYLHHRICDKSKSYFCVFALFSFIDNRIIYTVNSSIGPSLGSTGDGSKEGVEQFHHFLQMEGLRIYIYGWFHPGRRMTAKKCPYFFLRQNSNLKKYKYWRVTANL